MATEYEINNGKIRGLLLIFDEAAPDFIRVEVEGSGEYGIGMDVVEARELAERILSELDFRDGLAPWELELLDAGVTTDGVVKVTQLCDPSEPCPCGECEPVRFEFSSDDEPEVPEHEDDCPYCKAEAEGPEAFAAYLATVKEQLRAEKYDR